MSRVGCLLLVLAALGCGAARAELVFHPLFGSGMVLQQGRPVPVWGHGAPGATVSVEFAGQTRDVVVDDDGQWAVRLAPLAASAEPAVMQARMTGRTQALRLENVLVGEVWVASGQSNMHLPLSRTEEAEAEIAAADHPDIRFFTVGRHRVFEDLDEPYRGPFGGRWEVCTPASAGSFSAAAYYFARRLRADLDVPVGILHASVGGSWAELWTPEPELLELPFTAVQVEAHRAAAPGERKRLRLGSVFEGLIRPMIPFAIRGVLWYQGESNVARAGEYRELFPALIRGWRREWGQGDFPFLFVQLPNTGLPAETPVERAPRHGEGVDGVQRESWCALREAQTHALRLPETAMICSIDTSRTGDIHSEEKRDIGERLALAALGAVYGKPVAYGGPTFAGMTVEGGQARLRFDYADSGLTTRDGRAPLGFAIAGADRTFRRAQTRIDGGEIVAWHPDIAEPVAVRYAWANFPVVNLANRHDLPAEPFRTDDWEPTDGWRSEP